MGLVPLEWNVVVLGRWNRAILTPAGIGKRIFQVSQEVPLEVLIAIDAIEPPRVKHEGATVVVDSKRLIVTIDKQCFTQLEHACQLATRAIKSLPETPLEAVGYNVKYRASDYIDAIDQLFESNLANNAVANDFPIESQAMSIVVTHGKGRCSLILTREEPSTRTLLLNFERKSDDRVELEEWLYSSSKDIRNSVESMLKNLLSLQHTEVQYEIEIDEHDM